MIAANNTAPSRGEKRVYASRLTPLTLIGLICLSLALSSIASSSADAQIINVSSLAGKAVEEGFSSNLDIAASLNAGNIQFALATLEATTFYRTGDNTLMLSLKGAYGRSGPPGEWKDDPFRERTFEHLRYRHQITEIFSAEAFVQHEYDRWRRLKLRGLAGAGGRADLKPTKDTAVAVGLAYMAQLEELLKPNADDPKGLYLEHRLTSYLTVSHKIAEKSAVIGTGYLQPNIQNFSDIRALLDFAIVVGITDALALEVGYAVAFDTVTPKGVFGVNHTSSASLKVAF